MNDIFEALMKESNKNSTISKYEKNILRNIEKNQVLLKRNLSKKDKKFLLRIIDNKDLLSEHITKQNFASGFQLGLKLGMEINSK